MNLTGNEPNENTRPKFSCRSNQQIKRERIDNESEHTTKTHRSDPLRMSGLGTACACARRRCPGALYSAFRLSEEVNQDKLPA